MSNARKKLDIKPSQPKGFSVTKVAITNFAEFPSISQHNGPRQLRSLIQFFLN
jgi:hypothetical protein